MNSVTTLPRVLFDVADLHSDDVAKLLARASDLAAGARPADRLDKRTVALFFAQPSTRTRVGFAAAVARLGGSAIDVTGPKFQDGMDGPESLADTARVLDDYCDIVVVRHSCEAAVREFAAAAEVPVINAGAGKIAHPTQALVDLFAIRQQFGRVTGLRVGIAGDLSTSRTGRSLFRALARLEPVEIRLMAPADRHWSAEKIGNASARVTREDDLIVEGLDVLYVAGMPPGVGDDVLPLDVRKRFYVDRECLSRMSPSAIVLCALPRTGDIDPAADDDPRACYFQQSAHGLFVRMALLEAYAGWLP